MIKKSKIPTILAIVILLAGTFAGVFYLNFRQVFKIGASTSAQPKDVRISNISDNSATISWTTDSQTSDFLSWGVTEGSISTVENESVNGEKFFTHSISLSGLKPSSDYFFKINSEGADFDNNGVPWKFTTGTTLAINPFTEVISGSVINTSGQPVNRALIYITIDGYLASTVTSDTGNFVYQLGNVRTPDFQGYTQIDPQTTLLQVSASDGVGGSASAQIFPQSANPIPPMVLGQVYDFRNLQPSSNNQAPSANLSLPSVASQESKFNVVSASPSASTKSVVLESLSEGETITTTQPEFFGKGPPGATITIEVRSQDPITGDVTVPSSGSWSFSVPTNLAPGAHSVTITWKDATGITRSLTRNFIVQASELPAFEATPSGSASPTATPLATLAPLATITPEPTATGSPAPVPITGDLTPTILMIMMGLAVMAFSFIVWKTAES